MEFYTEISKYYDYIFPLNEDKLQFFQKALNIHNEKNLSILDVGTSTGSYAVSLAQEGCNVTAIDLNEIMLQKCQQKAKEADVNLKTLKLDMKNLVEKLKQKFNGIICIGNTLVHLSSLKEISQAITQMYQLLKPTGKLIIQIVNYDRILEKKIKELPRIEKEKMNLEFIRKYEFVTETQINFETTLKVKDKEIKNSIPLYPLTSAKLINIIEEIGFDNYNLYGGFDFSDYKKQESSPIVAVAKK